MHLPGETNGSSDHNGGPGASGPRGPDQPRRLVDLPPGPWRELLSGVTLPGGPTAPADLLAREPQTLLGRA